MLFGNLLKAEATSFSVKMEFNKQDFSIKAMTLGKVFCLTHWWNSETQKRQKVIVGAKILTLKGAEAVLFLDFLLLLYKAGSPD